MNTAEMRALAEKLNNKLKVLAKKKLYISFVFLPADEKYHDRIILEGIKNLHTTGRFSQEDIRLIDSMIEPEIAGLKFLPNRTDCCMYCARLENK